MKLLALCSLLWLAALSFSLPVTAEGKKKKNPPPAPPPATAPARPAPNGSLFSNTAPLADLYSDFRPRQVGDILFVDVAEGSSASVSSQAQHARTSGGIGGALIGIAPIPGEYAAAAAGVAGALGASKYQGKGSTERQSKLTARIAARVVEVFPNGDLRIEAEKSVKINRETEKLKLYGIVRRRDISPENAVSSTAVGDLKVELNGKGIASTDNAPGWLVRFFEKISPF